jgi:hypothetical protein
LGRAGAATQVVEDQGSDGVLAHEGVSDVEVEALHAAEVGRPADSLLVEACEHAASLEEGAVARREERLTLLDVAPVCLFKAGRERGIAREAALRSLDLAACLEPVDRRDEEGAREPEEGRERLPIDEGVNADDLRVAVGTAPLDAEKPARRPADLGLNGANVL